MTTLTLALLGSLALWSAIAPWDALTKADEQLGTTLLCVLLVGLTSGLLRTLGQSSWVSVPVAALVGLGVLLSSAGAAPFPTPGALAALSAALAQELSSIREFAVPIPADGGDLSVLITAVALVTALLVDAVLVRRGWASGLGFVLLFLHVLPSYFGTPARWQDFALTAGLFVLVLAVLQLRSEAPWQAASSQSRATAGRSTFNGVQAAAAGTAAIVLATVATTLLPLPDRPWWERGSSGGAGDEVTIANPLLDLRRDLVRGADVDLLTVRGSGPAPTYLRTAVLTEYDGEQWRTGDRRAGESDRATGPLPLPPGVAEDVAFSENEWTFSARDRFRSRWLPVPAQASAVTAPGDWRADSTTRDFVAWDPDLDSSGAQWTATELSLELDADRLDRASRAVPAGGQRWTEVPRTLPTIVSRLAQEVTADASTPFRKATALQQWFRTEFDYSLAAVESVGDDDLVAFLSPDGRVGYCEQFAASMALMARTLDIPARVAVGFLTPESGPDGTHVFSAHDLHAWPELYFEGAGWIRFEPTPGERANDIPEYTPAQSAAPEPSETPSASASAEPQSPTEEPSSPAAPRTDEIDLPTDGASSSNWLQIVGVAAGLLLLAGILALPRLVRMRRRATRVASQEPEAQWSEVKDTARDLGFSVPGGLSPRQGAEALLSSDLVLDSAVLDRVVRAVESTRYAPDATGVTSLSAEDLTTLLERMGNNLPLQRRVRGQWWPVSLVRR